MRRIDPRKIVIAVAAIVLAAIVVRAVRSSSGPAPDAADVEAARREVPPPPFPPDVRAPIAPEGVVVAPGLVEPAGREVRVGAPAAAVVRDVYVSEGDRVAAGAPLARLEDRVERAAAAAARSQARASAARARLARTIADRTTALAAKGVATPDELDRARLQAETAEAEAAASADAAAQALAAAERLTVRAPSAATVLRIEVRPGEHWNPEAGPLVIVGDLSALRARIEIDERAVARVAIGDPAYVTAEAYGDRRFAGRVVALGRRMGPKFVRTGDPTERLDTAVLEALLKLDAAGELVPGQRVTAYVGERAMTANR